MSGVSSWIMSILSIVILDIVADLLLSGKRLGKFIKGIFASLTILIIITPLPNLINEGLNSDMFSPSIKIDSDYNDYANEIKISLFEQSVEEALGKDGYHNVDVDIEASFDSKIDIKSVSINLANLVMDEKVVHINKYNKVAELVSGYLNIDKGIIIIYE